MYRGGGVEKKDGGEGENPPARKDGHETGERETIAVPWELNRGMTWGHVYM